MKTVNRKFAATLAVLSLFTLSTGLALDLSDTNTPAAAKPAKHKVEKPQKSAEKTTAAAQEGKAYPFHGTVASVDKKAMTITLEGKDKTRVISLGSRSLFEKDGKPATLGQLAVGDHFRGRLEKQGDQEILLKGTFGPAPEKMAGEAKPKKKKSEKAPPAPAPKPGTIPAPVPAKL